MPECELYRLQLSSFGCELYLSHGLGDLHAEYLGVLMALDEAKVSVSIGNGIDSKSDRKTVQVKVLQMIDGVFTSPNEVIKRPGNDSLTLLVENGLCPNGVNITTPLMSKSYNEELLIADGTNLYSYSPETGTGAFINKGAYPSVSVTDKQISVYTSGVFMPTLAATSQYTLFAYSTDGGGIYVSVMDNESQAFLVQDIMLSPSSSIYPQAVLLSGTTLGVVYVDGSNNLKLRTTAFSSTGVTFNPAVTIGSSANPNAQFIFNASTNSSFNFITYSRLTAGPAHSIGLISIDSSGTVISATNFSVAYVPDFLVCQLDLSNNIWLYWANVTTATSEDLFYAVYTSSLSSILTTTSIATGLSYLSNISPSIQSTGNQFLYYSTNTQAPTSSSPNYVTTEYAEVSTTAVVSTANPFLPNLELETKWITYLGVNYAVFSNIPGNRLKEGLGIGEQDTFFLIKEQINTDVATPLAVAKCLNGKAISGFLDSLILSGTTLVFGAPFVLFNDIGNSAGDLFVEPITGLEMVTFNFSDFEAYQSVIAGNTIILNGGIVQMYDGKFVVELGFNVFPENVIATPSTTGGFILAGGYTYAAVYEWYDATGNFHQSAPQETLQITTTGTTSSVAVLVQSLTLTQKSFPNTQSVNISLYRTLSNGTVFFKVGQLLNDPTSNNAVFTDTVPDTEIQSIPDLELYTTGGVVENIAPPPSMVMMSNQNRLWLVDAENPTNTIWPSKTYNPGTGISMSDLLNVIIDPRFGNITTLIGMDANTCILKSQENGGILIFSGDAANDTGQGSTITNPQVVPSDVGCEYSRGSILIPEGVIFKSSKGLYILSRGLSVSYFGAEAERYNVQNIQSALIAPNTSQVRFLTSSGSSLVYDYIFKQWGSFSNYLGYSSTIWNGFYVYCRTDGSVYIENPDTFLDATTPYNLTAQLSWIKTAGLQGWQRMRNCLLLGEHTSPVAGHGVQISAAYNYLESFDTPVPFTLATTSSELPFRYRNFFKRQKCASLSLLIQEITTGASGESISFTDLTLNGGVKKGLTKVSAKESVG